MEIAGLLIKQIIIMFVYMGLGYVLFKGKKITKEGSSSLANLLVWLIIPTVIIKSFCVEPTAERVSGLLTSIFAALVALFSSVLLCHFIFKKRPIDNIAASFSNAGFIGIPLVTATIGADAVFYIAFFVAMLNIMQWVYGVAVITEKKMKMNVSTLVHPLIFGLLAGLLLFFTGWGAKLPQAVTSTLGTISALNAPLAMIILGVYLAQTDLKSLWADGKLYFVSAVRLLLIPFISIVLFWAIHILIPAFTTRIALALLISVIAPVGSNVAVYAQLNGKDYVYASKTVIMSTLFCIVTVPVMILLAQFLIK